MTGKKALLFLLSVVSTLIIAACSMRAAQLDAAARLHTATQLTSETRKLISAILLDITTHEDYFDADSRREALNAIGRFHAKEYMPRVREIAAMTLDVSERSRHPDVVAISSALRVLADVGDGSAQTLNKQKLDDDSFRGFAIQNLRILHAWDATAAVEAELLGMRMSNANGNEVVAMLDFLLASPEPSERLCAAVDRVKAVYPECWRAHTASAQSFCVDLVLRSVELESAKCEHR